MSPLAIAENAQLDICAVCARLQEAEVVKSRNYDNSGRLYQRQVENAKDEYRALVRNVERLGIALDMTAGSVRQPEGQDESAIS